MIILPDIVFFDISAIMALLVIASLSKSIGEALKTPPYYKLLFHASIMIAVAAVADSLISAVKLSIPSTLPMGLRCFAGLIALPVCLRYWKWVISEFFKN
jgi:hypothetical protein